MYGIAPIAGIDTITVTSGNKSWTTLVPSGKSEDKPGTDDADPKK